MVNQKNTDHGFSMLELLSVMALIGILALLAAPSAKTYLASINLRTATSAIKQQLILARTKAMGNPNVHCGVYFNTGVTPNQTQPFLDTVDFYNYDANDPKYMPVFSMPKNVTINVGGTGSDKVMVFRGDGSAKTGNPGITNNQIIVTVTVAGQSGTLTRSKTISVLPSTGRIKVQ
jgi:prepilin-type N-terminal cleavage/methylation domain-containing protein